MNDFTTLTPLDAVVWYVENSDRHLDVDALRTLLGYGITDTAAIIEVASTSALDDLEKVPGLEPTLANLRLLAQVGPDVLAKDPENVSDWQALLKHPQIDRGDFETLAPFIASGRGPTFARQMLDLFERNADKFPDADNYDLTRPYAELADMVDNDIKGHELDRWKAEGFELADVIALQNSDINLERVKIMRHHGVPREQWATYALIPFDWLSEHRFNSEPGDLPEGIDLDLLLTMVAKGWGHKHIDVGGKRGRGRFHLRPWQVFAGDRDVTNLARHQVERMIAAGMTNGTASSYFAESRAGAGGDPRKTPPPLLVHKRDVELPSLDEMIGWWIKLADAGIRPSHLSEYRWVGCTTYQQILDAKAAGITPKRAKELRDQHGVKTGYQVSDTKRIAAYATLLTYHQADEENNSAATRPDERRVS